MIRNLRVVGGLVMTATLMLSHPLWADSDNEGFEAGDTSELTPEIMEPDAPSVTAPKPKSVAPEPVTAPPAPVAPMVSAPPSAPVEESEKQEVQKTEEPVTETANALDNPNANPTKEEAPEEKALTADAEKERREALLAAPTQSLEAYEAARKAMLYEHSLPRWAFDFQVIPKAFSRADLRVGKTAADPVVDNPNMGGLQFAFERVVMRGGAGFLALGLEGGGYGGTQKDPFGGLLPGFLSAGPVAQYQFNYFQRQLIVPTAAFEYEFVRYGYTYNNRKIRGVHALPRIDIGAMLFLNFLEPSAAGQMDTNWHVKRTYLSVSLSMASDSSKTDLDLSERAIRAGLRFEL